MPDAPQAVVTPAGVRDGDPRVLVELVARRGSAVLAFCEAVCEPEQAPVAAAEAFARFRAAVAAAGDPDALNPEALLLGATRHAGASMARASAGSAGLRGALSRGRDRHGPCDIVPALLVARAEGTLTLEDEDRLSRHLDRCPGCREVEAAFRRAERMYRSPPERAIDDDLLHQLLAALAGAAPLLAPGAEALYDLIETEPGQETIEADAVHEALAPDQPEEGRSDPEGEDPAAQDADPPAGHDDEHAWAEDEDGHTTPEAEDEHDWAADDDEHAWADGEDEHAPADAADDQEWADPEAHEPAADHAGEAWEGPNGEAGRAEAVEHDPTGTGTAEHGLAAPEPVLAVAGDAGDAGDADGPDDSTAPRAAAGLPRTRRERFPHPHLPSGGRLYGVVLPVAAVVVATIIILAVAGVFGGDGPAPAVTNVRTVAAPTSPDVSAANREGTLRILRAARRAERRAAAARRRRAAHAQATGTVPSGTATTPTTSTAPIPPASAP